MSIEKEWTTKAGYPAVAYRHDRMGHLCGYVGIPEGHPLHGIGYDHPTKALPRDEDGDRQTPCCVIDVHGGITYSDDHAPKQDSHELWWYGFDCAHLGDYVPGLGMNTSGRGMHEIERTVDFVVEECESMARQLDAIANAGSEA